MNFHTIDMTKEILAKYGPLEPLLSFKKVCIRIFFKSLKIQQQTTKKTKKSKFFYHLELQFAN